MIDAVSKLFEAQSQTERMMMDLEQLRIEFEQCQLDGEGCSRGKGGTHVSVIQMMQLMMAQRGQFFGGTISFRI